nr:hypothetical protein [uncultured Campylobacter sp.]
MLPLNFKFSDGLSKFITNCINSAADYAISTKSFVNFNKLYKFRS